MLRGDGGVRALDGCLRDLMPSASAVRVPRGALGNLIAEVIDQRRTAVSDAPETPRAPRKTAAVLSDALDELRAREQRLTVLTDELSDVRSAIKAIERIMGKGVGPVSHAAGGSTHRAILAALEAASEPLSMEQIAAKIGREPAGWLSMQLKRLVTAGDVVFTDGYGYSVKVKAA